MKTRCGRGSPPASSTARASPGSRAWRTGRPLRLVLPALFVPGALPPPMPAFPPTPAGRTARRLPADAPLPSAPRRRRGPRRRRHRGPGWASSSDCSGWRSWAGWGSSGGNSCRGPHPPAPTPAPGSRSPPASRRPGHPARPPDRHRHPARPRVARPGGDRLRRAEVRRGVQALPAGRRAGQPLRRRGPRHHVPGRRRGSPRTRPPATTCSRRRPTRGLAYAQAIVGTDLINGVGVAKDPRAGGPVDPQRGRERFPVRAEPARQPVLERVRHPRGRARGGRLVPQGRRRRERPGPGLARLLLPERRGRPSPATMRRRWDCSKSSRTRTIRRAGPATACCRSRGRGVEVDNDKAFYWFNQAGRARRFRGAGGCGHVLFLRLRHPERPGQSVRKPPEIRRRGQ